jgi:hypothetical protein
MPGMINMGINLYKAAMPLGFKKNNQVQYQPILSLDNLEKSNHIYPQLTTLDGKEIYGEQLTVTSEAKPVREILVSQVKAQDRKGNVHSLYINSSPSGDIFSVSTKTILPGLMSKEQEKLLLQQIQAATQ